MALSGKIESELEIKATPVQFYNFLKNQIHHLPNISANIVHHIELHEGDYQTHGSIKTWKYTIDGEVETLKEKVEFDDENKKVTFVGLEGNLMNKYYKVFKPTYQVIPKGEGSLTKLSIEYEKLKEDVPLPNKYLDLMNVVTKDMDEHILKP